MRGINRRTLLAGASTAALAAQSQPASAIDWNRVRSDFPWISNRLWLTNADYHPMGVHSKRAIDEHLRARVEGEGESSSSFHAHEAETKSLYAKLINASPSEIAFVQSTTEGENLVVAGLRIGETKGNVVIDDLHYQASKFLYRMLEKEGRIELRVVPHGNRDGYWTVDPAAMERAIDRNTRLVSIALVSNINGYLHDVRRTAAVAHQNGALLYADIIQGAGATPIDVQSMGIDFAACGTYKWLQADFGFGFLYVRQDLHDRLQRSRYGVRQFSSPNNAQADSQFKLRPGAARYEAGSFSYGGAAAVHASLKYIHSLGIPNIRAHARRLTARLQAELPKLGYPALTPPDNDTAIVSFRLPEYDKTAAKLKKAFKHTAIALRRWEFTSPKGEVSIVPGMRISPSIYNNDADVDRLLEALS